MRQKLYAWMDAMTTAAGDDIDERLWSTTSTPDGSSPVELQGFSVADGNFEVEFDEKVGWISGGAVVETTDSLTNGWTTVPAELVEQIDRFLDQGTYRATVPAEDPQRFMRIRAE